MKLLYAVQVSENQTMAIYELSEAGFSEFGKKYALASSQFSDRALARYSESELIKRLDPGYYEKLFDTANEAYLTAKLIAAIGELERIRGRIKEIQDLRIRDIDWDPDF